MARKKKHEEHANHERWLVSYADFITLLFAFFVVMFAVSQVDSKKVGRFSESFAKAVGLEIMPENGKTLMPGEGDQPSAPMGGGVGDGSMMSEEMKGLKQAVEKIQQKEGADAGPPPPDAGPQDPSKGIQVLARRHEIVIRLSDSVLFQSADDAVTEESRRVIRSLAKELASRKVDVRIEGHTDDRPLRGTGRFRSNWDLSTGRATAVLAELAAGGVAPERLSAAGYGEFHPVASNAAEPGRRQNRRVDLVVSMSATPAPPPKEPSP